MYNRLTLLYIWNYKTLESNYTPIKMKEKKEIVFTYTSWHPILNTFSYFPKCSFLVTFDISPSLQTWHVGFPQNSVLSILSSQTTISSWHLYLQSYFQLHAENCKTSISIPDTAMEFQTIHPVTFQTTSLGCFMNLKDHWTVPSSVQLLSCVQFFVTPRTSACQASLSITNSRSLLKLMSIKSVMPSNYLILCCPLLLLPLIFPSIRVFPNESVCIIWPKYWSFSFSISPSNEYSGLISFRIDWFDIASQGTLKSLVQQHSSKASILRCFTFFMVQLSHPYMTAGKTIALTIWTFEWFQSWAYYFPFRTLFSGTSPGMWLRLHIPSAGCLGSIPGQGAKVHML